MRTRFTTIHTLLLLMPTSFFIVFWKQNRNQWCILTRRCACAFVKKCTFLDIANFNAIWNVRIRCVRIDIFHWTDLLWDFCQKGPWKDIYLFGLSPFSFKAFQSFVKLKLNHNCSLTGRPYLKNEVPRWDFARGLMGDYVSHFSLQIHHLLNQLPFYKKKSSLPT